MKILSLIAGLLLLPILSFAQPATVPRSGGAGSGSATSTNLTGNALVQATNIARSVVGQSNGMWVLSLSGVATNLAARAASGTTNSPFVVKTHDGIVVVEVTSNRWVRFNSTNGLTEPVFHYIEGRRISGSSSFAAPDYAEGYLEWAVGQDAILRLDAGDNNSLALYGGVIYLGGELGTIVSNSLRVIGMVSNNAAVNTVGQIADGTFVQIANGTGSQTPWLSDINAAGFTLTNNGFLYTTNLNLRGTANGGGNIITNVGLIIASTGYRIGSGGSPGTERVAMTHGGSDGILSLNNVNGNDFRGITFGSGNGNNSADAMITVSNKNMILGVGGNLNTASDMYQQEGIILIPGGLMIGSNGFSGVDSFFWTNQQNGRMVWGGNNNARIFYFTNGAFAVMTNWFVVTNGNVGIRTANPLVLLDLNGSSSSEETTIISLFSGVNYGIGMGPTATEGFISYRSGSGSSAIFGHKFFVNNVERMRVNGLGNVGIGTTTPTNTLQVTGISMATAGFASYSSNLQAVTQVTLGASPSLWTNTSSRNVSFGWRGAAVTGVSINSSEWMTALTGGMGILQPGEYVGFTNSIIPTFSWKPF